jgi:nitroreductase
MLGLAGSGLALVVAGGWWRVTRVPETATLPWRLATAGHTDPRLAALAHAILAPNPHNRQPWLIRLDGDGGVTVRCDLARRLPETDPLDRQIAIGFGCFAELAVIAATKTGHAVEVQAFPEGVPEGRLDGRPVLRLVFAPQGVAARDPLAAAILDRRSVKRPFDMARVPDGGTLAGVAAAGGADAGYTVDPTRVALIRDIAWRAWTVEAETPRTFRESVDLMRVGAREIDASPDGISLGGPMIETLAAAGHITRERLADPGSSAFRAGVQRYRAMIAATPAFLWIGGDETGHLAAMAAGRAYVRANLAATAAGLAMHPVSQALQEFPEMAALRREASAALGLRRPQMLARIGYAESPGPSPRWPLSSRLIS